MIICPSSISLVLILFRVSEIKEIADVLYDREQGTGIRMGSINATPPAHSINRLKEKLEETEERDAFYVVISSEKLKENEEGDAEYARCIRFEGVLEEIDLKGNEIGVLKMDKGKD